ncbi:hypothetical protein D7S86_27360 [Pararobbsia silviterrae]|uniref:Tetratricopeptide repeat protein n=1 Tax=Pararobbsia silviterrae TaxID=1792498 RepID=A0A494X305_9BURK|nr:hypothetical protein D7S86_27360 [Pararobbsia silviterrae]
MFFAYALAFALPTPHQIEDALAANDYASARSMLQQVLVERPDSARAHLLNAYVLEHVDHNVGAARAELQTATGLDKRGDVKGSALYGRVIAEMDAQPVAPAAAQPTPRPAAHAVASPQSVSTQPPHNSDGFALLVVLLFVVVVLGIVALVSRAMRPPTVVIHHRHNPDPRHVRRAAPSPAPLPPSGAHVVYVPERDAGAYPSTVIVPPAAPVRGGMTAGENFASTAGGVVAGNLISDSLLHSHHSSRDIDDDDERRRRRRDLSDDAVDAPIQSRAPSVDYATERASFSSSSSDSDSWSPSPISSSSSSSDSWSNSSGSDSSSSSWDSGGSSSSDCGSSSGGSDWS